MDNEQRSLRVLCHHAGPRGRQYGIPAALAMNGMLAAFYTDFCIGHRTSVALQRVWPSRFRPRILQNLLSRSLPRELPRSRVRCLPIWEVRGKSAAIGAAIGNKIRRDRFAGANAIYSIFNPDLEMLREAKAHGLYVIHDQVLNPDVGLILQEERARYPGFEKQDDEGAVQRGIRRDGEQWELADLILAPSEFVRDSIIRLGGPQDKIRLVPYGIQGSWLDSAPKPVAGRILFVGSVGLRKGTHYLAEAARLLRQRGVQCEVLVVGRHDRNLIARPEFQGPRYVGSVARSQVRDWFLSADVFVHPSLSEGSAVAHIEALACGLPVVATTNAGTVIEDGVEGYLVRPRDAAALADRLQEIINDRSLRAQMSSAARQRALDLTLEAYAARLKVALKTHPIHN